MHSHSIDDFRHSHVFLGAAHERNERKTWTVIAICAAMMVAEIIGGLWFGSVALIADGLHMSAHAGAHRVRQARSDHLRTFVGVSPCPLPRPGHEGPHDEDDRDLG